MRSEVAPGRRVRLDRLTAPSRALSDEASLEKTLEVTVDTAESLLATESVVLLLQDPRGELRIRAARGVSAEARERFEASLDETLFQRLTALLDVGPSSAFMGVPLLAKGKIAGLLVVLLPKERHDERDEWMLSALADQASAALEHALQEADRVDLAAQLEELRARGDLQEHALQVVQHDLRTPIGAIRGYLDLLERGAYGPMTPRQSAALERIDVAVAHLERLVEEALEMSHVVAGQISVACEPVDARRVVEQAVSMVDLDAGKAQVSVRAVLTDGTLVLADEARLRQVLIHLLDNAVKHAGAGSDVLVECAPEAGTDVVMIRISDDGPGVPPELAREIFEPYKSFGGRGGSGLGLAIARGVTELMGGEIGVESGKISGATFFVRLPRAS